MNSNKTEYAAPMGLEIWFLVLQRFRTYGAKTLKEKLKPYLRTGDWHEPK